MAKNLIKVLASIGIACAGAGIVALGVSQDWTAFKDLVFFGLLFIAVGAILDRM